jgi:hypothetical protein
MIVFLPSISKISAPSTSTGNTNAQMRFELHALGVTCDRTGDSDKAPKLIESTALQDVGLVTKDNISIIVERERAKLEDKEYNSDMRIDKFNPMLIAPLCCLYLDGRKDKPIVQEDVGGMFCRITVTEEHFLGQKPGCKYIGHLLRHWFGTEYEVQHY